MNELRYNSYNFRTGMLEGDHLRHLAGIGIHKLVERVNGNLYGSKPLSAADLPSKVRDLVAQSEKLAEQLLKCDAVPISMGKDYLAAQARLAGDALPLLSAEVERRELSVRDALAQLRSTLTGKGGVLVSAAVDVLLQDVEIRGAIEREVSLSAWRTAHAIVRDTASNKVTPRWLTILISQHEAAKHQAAAIG